MDAPIYKLGPDLAVGQRVVYLGGGYPPRLIEDTIARLVPGDPIKREVCGIVGYTIEHRVHVAGEPDGADHFPEAWVWPDTPQVREFLDGVRRELLDEAVFYVFPRYREDGGIVRAPTDGEMRRMDLDRRMAAFRLSLAA